LKVSFGDRLRTGKAGKSIALKGIYRPFGTSEEEDEDEVFSLMMCI
jgi:hypothetical protein